MKADYMFVCINCFEDTGLVNFIKANAIAESCSFCTSKDNIPIATSIREVEEHFMSRIFQEYDLAANHLGWDKEENGWFGISWDTYDLVLDELELEFPQDNMETLLPLLFGEYLDQQWCESNGYGPNDEEWAQQSWSAFREVVMHRRRFFFLDVDHSPDDTVVYRPREVLQAISEYADSEDLFLVMDPGTTLVRARREGWRPHLKLAEELGPPPTKATKSSNRMSPAGISMFYGSDEEITALKEIESSPGWYAVGRFETLRPAILLDLAKIPPVPSLFEPASEGAEFSRRSALKFLRHVSEQMSIRIHRDDRIHIDYVPTQVVTEFIRDQFRWGTSRIDGIRYLSSAREGYVCYVLFASQQNIVQTRNGKQGKLGEDRWLKLSAPPSHKLWWAWPKAKLLAVGIVRYAARLWPRHLPLLSHRRSKAGPLVGMGRR